MNHLHRWLDQNEMTKLLVTMVLGGGFGLVVSTVPAAIRSGSLISLMLTIPFLVVFFVMVISRIIYLKS